MLVRGKRVNQEALDADVDGPASAVPGGPRVAPLQSPDGFTECENYPDLYYRWEAAWGGAMLLGTETLAVVLYNVGYSLADVVVEIVGDDHKGATVFMKQHEVTFLPRGKEVTIEVPSYELRSPASNIKVALLSGRYADEA
jgi:hypothetical protein